MEIELERDTCSISIFRYKYSPNINCPHYILYLYGVV